MTRNRLWAMLLAVAMTAVVIAAFFVADRAPNQVPGDIEVTELDSASAVAQLYADNISSASATYMDVTDSIEEMAADADLIAVVRVVSRRQYSPVAVGTTVTLDRILKGTYAGDEIVIFQIGTLDVQSDHLLNEGAQYLLFLGKQTDGQDHTFYIKGGEQGIFYADGDRIAGRDPRFVSELRQAAVSGPGLAALEAHVQTVLGNR